MRKLLWVCVGAILVLAVGSAGAYFTSRAEVPDNIIRAGTVAVSAEPTSAAITMDGMAPGTTQTKSLTVLNDGNLPVYVVLTTVKKAGITLFWESLTCRVTTDGTLLYEGPLSLVRTAPLYLTPAQRAEVQFAVTLPAETGNDLAADYVKMSVYVDAEQAH